MDIVGGLYHEICDFPPWRAIRGSGGRAAWVLADKVETRLHCYATRAEEAAIEELRSHGVTVNVHGTALSTAFAYFHGLSTPHIEPAPDSRTPAEAFKVVGSTILRFGLLEGDPIIKATGRAIYDPQTANDPAPFHANGSTAEEWALVVNERELEVMGGGGTLQAAAARVHAQQGASVVVAKCGPTGAQVFVRDADRPTLVPAYASEQVFKIGTGDVFSAAFALYWGERGLAADQAADRASRAVSDYCEDPLGRFPDDQRKERLSVPIGTTAPIILLGAGDTLGQRYVLEEVRFRLRELNVVVNAPALDHTTPDEDARVVLVIADGARDEVWDEADALVASGARRIILIQDSDLESFRRMAEDKTTSDFTTAVYWAVWAAQIPVDLSSGN